MGLRAADRAMPGGALPPDFPVAYAGPGYLETSVCDAADSIGKRHGEIFRGGTAGMLRGEIERALACLERAADIEDEAPDSPTTWSPPSPGALARRPCFLRGARGHGGRPGGRPSPAAAPPTQGVAYDELYTELARLAGVNWETFEQDHVPAIQAAAVPAIQASAGEPAEDPRGHDSKPEAPASCDATPLHAHDPQQCDRPRGRTRHRTSSSTQSGGSAGSVDSGMPFEEAEEPGDGVDYRELYEGLAAASGALSAELFARDHMPSLRSSRAPRAGTWRP